MRLKIILLLLIIGLTASGCFQKKEGAADGSDPIQQNLDKSVSERISTLENRLSLLEDRFYAAGNSLIDSQSPGGVFETAPALQTGNVLVELAAFNTACETPLCSTLIINSDGSFLITSPGAENRGILNREELANLTNEIRGTNLEAMAQIIVPRDCTDNDENTIYEFVFFSGPAQVPISSCFNDITENTEPFATLIPVMEKYGYVIDF